MTIQEYLTSDDYQLVQIGLQLLYSQGLTNEEVIVKLQRSGILHWALNRSVFRYRYKNNRVIIIDRGKKYSDYEYDKEPLAVRLSYPDRKVTPFFDPMKLQKFDHAKREREWDEFMQAVAQNQTDSNNDNQ